MAVQDSYVVDLYTHHTPTTQHFQKSREPEMLEAHTVDVMNVYGCVKNVRSPPSPPPFLNPPLPSPPSLPRLPWLPRFQNR